MYRLTLNTERAFQKMLPLYCVLLAFLPPPSSLTHTISLPHYSTRTHTLHTYMRITLTNVIAQHMYSARFKIQHSLEITLRTLRFPCKIDKH